MLSMFASRALLISLAFSAASAAPVEVEKNTQIEIPPPGSVLALSDATFNQLIRADPDMVWFVNIGAPWCIHCRQLAPVWDELARTLRDHEKLRFAKVDVTKNPVLVSRFWLKGYPSIYVLKGGQAWAYSGSRSMKPLLEFGTGGYLKEMSLPFWKTPNNGLGMLLGHVHSLPSEIKATYTVLKEQYGWSDLGVVCAVLAVPVVAGMFTICAMDAFVLRHMREGQDHGEMAVGAEVVGQAAEDHDDEGEGQDMRPGIG